MLSSVEQEFVGRDKKRAPLKMPGWEAIKAHACDGYFTSNCTFISQRNSNPNARIASTLGVQLPSGPQVSVLVSQQESTVEREFSCCSYCRRVHKARVDCIYGRYAFRFRFYTVHPYTDQY